jgi:hypothetical protein
MEPEMSEIVKVRKEKRKLCAGAKKGKGLGTWR